MVGRAPISYPRLNRADNLAASKLPSPFWKSRDKGGAIAFSACTSPRYKKYPVKAFRMVHSQRAEFASTCLSSKRATPVLSSVWPCDATSHRPDYDHLCSHRLLILSSYHVLELINVFWNNCTSPASR